MRKITKKYKVWNYLAVILLSLSMVCLAITSFFSIVDYHEVIVVCISIIAVSIIWICIVPMFLGNLAKEKRLKAKFWFAFTIIVTLITIIVAFYGLANNRDFPNRNFNWHEEISRDSNGTINRTTYHDNQGNIVSKESYDLAKQRHKEALEHWLNRQHILLREIGIFALLPVISLFAFFLYLRFSSLDWSHEEPSVEIEEHDVAEELDSSEIPDVCPHCRNKNVQKLRECEWCGNKVC